MKRTKGAGIAAAGVAAAIAVSGFTGQTAFADEATPTPSTNPSTTQDQTGTDSTTQTVAQDQTIQEAEQTYSDAKDAAEQAAADAGGVTADTVAAADQAKIDADAANEAAQQAKTEADAKASEADAALSDAKDTQSAAASELADAQQKQADAQQAVEDAQAAVEQAQADLDAARNAQSDDAIKATQQYKDLQEAKAALAKAQADKASADQAVTDAETAADAANEALAKANQAVAAAQEKADAAATAANKDAAAQQAAQEELAKAKSILADAQQAAQDAQKTVEEKTAAKAQADKEAQEAAKALSDAEAALTDAQADLANKQTAAQEAQTALTAAQGDLKKAQDELAAVANTQHSTREFFESNGSTSAVSEIDTPGERNPQSGNTFTDKTVRDTTSEAFKQDATNLEYLDEAITIIENTNKLRRELGLPELKINDKLMAEAEINVNWSSTIMDHAYQEDGMENLAWNYGTEPLGEAYNSYFKRPTGWYYEEKATFDELAKNNTALSAALSKDGVDSFVDWAIRMQDLLGDNYGSVGHYVTFMNPFSLYTGAAFAPHANLDGHIYNDTENEFSSTRRPRAPIATPPLSTARFFKPLRTT
ncbi:MAG: CAP domain-containing protein [Olegusella sp.]|nr:CAP domain-containing protein [Olegusella sp.]